MYQAQASVGGRVQAFLWAGHGSCPAGHVLGSTGFTCMPGGRQYCLQCCKSHVLKNAEGVFGAPQVAVRANVPSAGINLAEDVYGPFSGQVTSAVRQAMRRAVLEAHARLVEAMFLCELSSTAEVLSGTAMQLSACRGRQNIQHTHTICELHLISCLAGHALSSTGGACTPGGSHVSLKFPALCRAAFRVGKQLSMWSSEVLEHSHIF